MKQLLTILSFFILSFVNGQVTYKFRYYSVTVGGIDVYYCVAMPSDSITNSNKRPLFCWEPGAGETAGAGNMTQAKAVLHGYLRDLYLELWDGGVKQSNGYSDSIVYPIYASMQYNSTAGNSVATNRDRWNVIRNDYAAYIDTNQMHMSGLSLGGRQVMYNVANVGSSSGSPYVYAHSYATFVAASPGGTSSSITNNSAYMGIYAKKGGRFAIATGKNDNQGVYFTSDLLAYFNDSVPGSAIGMLYQTGVEGFTEDGHGGWDTLYKNDRTFDFTGGKSIYEWQLQFTKTPKAVAQTTINTSGNSVTLNGVSNGWYKSVAWTKVSGGSATIVQPSKDTTTVSGLSAGDYTFRMTVTNTNTSATATHDVTVHVEGGGGGTEKQFIKPKHSTWKVEKTE